MTVCEQKFPIILTLGTLDIALAATRRRQATQMCVKALNNVRYSAMLEGI
jgi:hypothetical protein